MRPICEWLKSVVGYVLFLQVVALLTGCATMQAPQYQPDFEMINTLKDIPLEPMQVGVFTSADPDVEKISVRGLRLSSPYDGSHASYLRNALDEELKQAGLWDRGSAIVISGELLVNKLDAGINIGDADVSARFRVDRAGARVYDKVHTIHHEWESAFVAMVAVPNCINNYPLAMQKLINEFLLDIEFLQVVGKQGDDM